MLDTRLQPFATLQQTDESAFLERSISGIFVTKQLNNFATVSTTTLVVHKSGNCIVEEYAYTHRNKCLLFLFGNCMRRPFEIAREVRSFSFKIQI
jgi:hypothetical protein